MMAASGVIVVLFLCSVIPFSDEADRDCLTVQGTCAKDPVCGPMQSTYLMVCASAFLSGGTCSQACKNSYNTLLDNAIGEQLYQCDCATGSNATRCRNSTVNLLKNCFNGVAPSPSSVISATRQSLNATVTCVAAQTPCITDSVCGSLFVAYALACNSAFLGVYCSQLCDDSFYDLLSDPVGSQFYGCQCGNDAVCEMSGANLVRTCYNGSYPVAPPIIVPPTAYANGTCESFYGLCFERRYSICGDLFRLAHDSCRSLQNVSQNITCSGGCKAGLQSLLDNVFRAQDALVCTCTNFSSSVCQTVIEIQRLFYVCGVSAPTDQGALPTSPSTPPPGSCEDNYRKCVQQRGSQCKSSVQQTFQITCGYFFNRDGQANLSFPCTAACRSKLQALANNSTAGAILTCNCVDDNSLVCRLVMSYRPIFSHCDVSAPTAPYLTAKAGPGSFPTVKEGGPGKAANVEASLLIVFISLVFAHSLLIA